MVFYAICVVVFADDDEHMYRYIFQTNGSRVSSFPTVIEEEQLQDVCVADLFRHITTNPNNSYQIHPLAKNMTI